MAVECPEDPLFDRAYSVLRGYFGAAGEIEPRAVLARVVAAPFEHRGIWVAHPLVVALDESGELAGVGGRYVTYEPSTGVGAVLDGSGWIAEAHRRRGLGALMLPMTFDAGLVRLAPQGALAARTLLDFGDLGPVRADDPESLSRAIAWGHIGAAVIPPEVFPFALVGMEEGGDVDALAAPLPILAFLRLSVGQRPEVDKATLHTLARHLEAAHAWAGPAGCLDAATLALHAAIDRAHLDPVPLLALPRSMDNHAPFDALFRASDALGRPR